MTQPVSADLPPSPQGGALLGNYREFRADALRSMRKWQRGCGDLVRFRLGPQQFYMVSSPVLAEEILMSRQEQFVKVYSPERPRGLALILGQGLVTSKGDLWRRQRRLIQPLFVRSRVADYAGEILAAGQSLRSRWNTLASGTVVDMGAEMMRATLEVITRTMFNTSVADKLDRLSPVLQTVLKYAADDMRYPVPIPEWVPTPRNLEFRRAMRFLDEMVYELIDERRNTGIRRDDLLDKLIHARDEESGQPMDDQQIRDEVLTIFTAGHETTALTLTWAWYLLAGNPDARDRLSAEIEEVLNGREPSMDDLPRLTWTRAVIEESLRLYPPAAIMIRKNVGDTTLGGYRIPKDARIILNVANIHRHRDYWQTPEDFRPERFIGAQEKPSHRLAFMPFGAGQRVCVGNSFAIAESILLMAMLGGDYRLERIPGQVVEPEIEVTLRPKGGIRLAVFKSL